ncbi:MAG: DUF1588 domain-containing protein [Myxococcales bacterium]
MTRRLLAGYGCVVLLALGCGKTGQRPIGEVPELPSAGGGNGGADATGGSGPAGTSGMPESACQEAGPTPGSAPLSVLSNFELNRSVRALLGDALPELAPPWLPEDGYVAPGEGPPGGFDEQLHGLAHDLALRVSQDGAALRKLSGCDPVKSGEATCAAAFIDAFVARAYRRPATPEDAEDMRAVFAEGKRLGGDFASGIRAVIEVTLQSPEFAYLLELGSDQVENDSVALTGYESAARLAYFLTGAPPDDALAALASKGSFSADTLESEAQRLLGTPANRELVRYHYASLFGWSYVSENQDLGFDAELVSAAREESGRFVEDVTFDGNGTFRELLTEPTTWVNEPLAKFYGLPGVSGPEYRKVMLDPTQRGGLFTQSAFLRANSHPDSSSPVQRGLSVLRHLLCYDPPPPPAAVPVTLPGGTAPDATMRERLTISTQDAVCQSCHRDINPLGFAFEHYDAVGKWRDTENGRPIDSSGELYRTDAKGEFADAIQLMQRIAESDDAKACFIDHWLERAYRRTAEPADACAANQLAQAFAASDGKLAELMVALAKTDNFRFRRKSELPP